MFSLPTIKTMNDAIAQEDGLLGKDTKLFYEFIELLEAANKHLDEAEGNLQASFHVLYDLDHIYREDKEINLANQIKSIRESLAKLGGLLRKKHSEVKETEVIVWGLHKEQERKKKKKARRKKK